ncbi:MAG: ATP-binding protein [Kofleriaceae bacterium]|nr:ATP-binding protein [Kofleriaceae bacterium]
MAPYRTTEREEAAEAPRDQGIVGDVIAQFADPLAFYRELVQNAIDAGSPAVHVSLAYDAGHVVVRVADRGGGMTRDILENQLLVLFRSTKEKDPTKIGKFGIGFTSVLATNPVLVVVSTVRDGKRLALHLRPDLTYELFDGGNATQAGTVVELELRITAEEAAAYARRSYEALEKWCRHAEVPVQFEANVPGLTTPLLGRIDRPFALDNALLEISATSPDDQLRVVVGIERDPRSYVGFFNRGLTLYETSTGLVGPLLSAKLKGGGLGHTLSRDNVRRDQHYDAALAFARELARTELPRIASTEQRAAAEAGDALRYAELAQALLATGLETSIDKWWVPLAVPTAGLRAMRVGEMPRPLRSVAQPTKLATAFAAANVPVALLPPDLTARLGAESLAEAFVRVEPIEPTPHDLTLVGELQQILEVCKRAPTRIELAELEGVHDTSLAISGGRQAARLLGDGDYVLARDAASQSPLGKFSRGTLVLNVRHALVVAARRSADPRVAASHLARVLLCGYGLLDAKRSERILARGLAALGIGGGT